MKARQLVVGLLVAVIAVAAVAAVLLLQQPAQQPTTPQPTQPAPQPQTPPVREIKVGMLCDLTGGTSDVGKPYCLGALDAREWFEKFNPLPQGYKVDLAWVDYSYKIPEAQAAYSRFKALGVVAIIGWGTGDTLALAPTVHSDKIPYISASYSGELLKNTTMYNFFPQTDYSSQGRAFVRFAVDLWNQMHGGRAPRPPKLGLAYPNVPYGTTPLPAIRDMANQLGAELCPDQIVELAAVDATSQMLKFKECGADFVWAGGTAASTLVIMRDAKKVGLNAPIFVNVWGGNEAYFRANPEASAGNYYLSSISVYTPDIERGDSPGAKIIREWAREKGRGPSDLTAAYVRGWANVNVLYKALRMVIEKGEPVTGENIWKALTSIRNWDFSPLTGITAESITWTPEDRRPMMSVFVYRINERGEFELARKVTLDRKAEWLGW
ncbi:MAG: ABC transporter substrate-binding protein [Thaumarchaeota archaeon]|nr:ABC transporter substrate-binding protein [Candidatus Calditenuaceae archaeon]MDW8187144.1 ABC transporter substrate-binding protein [Nitrososphaerota archaeon]